MKNKAEIILFDDRAQAIGAKKKAACNGRGVCLGISFLTAKDFLSELWDLYGDGSHIVDSGLRELLIYSLLKEFGFKRFLGTAKAISEFVERNFDLLDFGKIDDLDISPSQKKILRLIERYSEIIEDKALIEPTATFQVLEEEARKISVDSSNLVSTPLPYSRFVEQVCGVEKKTGNPKDHPASKGLRFLIPTGFSAREKLICDEIEALISDGFSDFVVASSDPKEMYLNLEKMLAEKGDSDMDIRFGLEETFKIGSTHFGKALKSVYDLCLGKRLMPWIISATDFALSPYARINPFSYTDIPSQKKYLKGIAENKEKSIRKLLNAYDLNSVWRGDRTLDSSDAIIDLDSLSPTFRIFRSFVEGISTDTGDIQADLVAFKKIARLEFSSIECEEELAAINRFESFINAVSENGIDAHIAIEMALDCSVSMGFIENVGDPDRRRDEKCMVRVIPLDNLRHLMPSSCDVLILDDVSDLSLNVKTTENPLDSLSRDLGLESHTDRIDDVRDLFIKAQRAVRDVFVCTLLQRDKNTEEIYPSFVFDEFVMDRFSGCVDASAIQKIRFGDEVSKEVAGSIMHSTRTLGEQDVVSGIGKRGVNNCDVRSYDKVSRATLSTFDIQDSIPKVETVKGKRFVLSPSSIELYMGCPYKWFLQRKLKVSGLDEGFGALEMGNLAHDVLESFYSEIMRIYGPVVRIGDVERDESYSIFNKVFDDVLAKQPTLEPLSGRCVFINSLEEHEIMKLKESIFKSIELHSSLPEGFHVRSVERTFDPFSEGGRRIEYGGVFINGRIDRIDDDDSSRFYILDYKGSIASHDAGLSSFSIKQELIEEDGLDTDKARDIVDGASKCFLRGDVRFDIDTSVYPDHIQTLIYAAIENRLRVDSHERSDCIGALYTSYKARTPKKLVVGSFDATRSDFYRISDDKSAVPDLGGGFSVFLDMVESLVSVYIDKLLDGDIPTKTRNKNNCEYCAFRECPGRM